MKDSITTGCANHYFKRFFKFCLVGGSGVLIDMIVIHFLSGRQYLGWNIVASKLLSAEAAMINNFVWNELWTFRTLAEGGVSHEGWLWRLFGFHAICGLGILMATGLVYFLYEKLKLNLYLANSAAILVVTFWNFLLNAFFNWRVSVRYFGDTDSARL